MDLLHGESCVCCLDPSGEIRYIMELPLSSWRQARLHRSLALKSSNLPTEKMTDTARCRVCQLGSSGEIRDIMERLRQAVAGGAHPRRIIFFESPHREKEGHGKSHVLLFGPSGEIRTPGILIPNESGDFS